MLAFLQKTLINEDNKVMKSIDNPNFIDAFFFFIIRINAVNKKAMGIRIPPIPNIPKSIQFRAVPTNPNEVENNPKNIRTIQSNIVFYGIRYLV